jgi:hypothetical protein
MFLLLLETWSLTIREEHTLRVFENRVFRRRFGPKRFHYSTRWVSLSHQSSDNGFQRRSFPFLWVPKLFPCLSNSKSWVTVNSNWSQLQTSSNPVVRWPITGLEFYPKKLEWICYCSSKNVKYRTKGQSESNENFKSPQTKPVILTYVTSSMWTSEVTKR